MSKRKPAVTHKQLVDALIAELPTSWLDNLLTGPGKVVGDPPYGCPDIERLFWALKKRMEDKANKLLSGSDSKPLCLGGKRKVAA